MVCSYPNHKSSKFRIYEEIMAIRLSETQFNQLRTLTLKLQSLPQESPETEPLMNEIVEVLKSPELKPFMNEILEVLKNPENGRPHEEVIVEGEILPSKDELIDGGTF